MKETYTPQDLIDFTPRHDLFFGIDSDGCVFDSMTIKQRIFRDGIIEFWGLEDTAVEVRRICEWVGLYSPWRGLNRFQLILKIFQCLEEFIPSIGMHLRCHTARRGARAIDCSELELKLPIDELAAFVASGVPLSMSELAKQEDVGLKRVLAWSEEMSRRIAELPPIPEFDEVFRGLEKLRDVSDLIVVSQTTEDALVREWCHAELEEFVDVIAGAELGSKAESLTCAAVGRYALDKIVMVGDAPGDFEAAQAVGCLFFPIIPGAEVASWIELREEGIERVLNGTFAGAYQDDLIDRFNASLSPTPPWIR